MHCGGGSTIARQTDKIARRWDVGADGLREIDEKFQPMFESVGKPITMAVFVRCEEGNAHCQATAFFSPTAQECAESFGASPCAPPLREGLEPLPGG
ncbi:MAG TPA: hypothetical protein PKH47_06245 [Anaerolineales bacterium]|nr:hypothetical protein [Anaerolineales bacterium]